MDSGVLGEWLTAMQDKPEMFLKDVLGVGQTWPGQDLIVRSVAENALTAVPSGHSLGKDWLAARLALWFLFCHCPSIVLMTGPTARQVNEVVWGELTEAYHGAKIPLGGDLLQTVLRVDERRRWYAMGFTTKDSAKTGFGKFQGFHQQHVMIVVTEGQAVEKRIWDQAESLRTAVKFRLLAIGNPLVSYGEFHNACQPKSGYSVVRLDCEDSPNVREGRIVIPGLATKEYVEMMAGKYGKESPTYLSKVKGIFPPRSEDVPIEPAWLDRAQNVTEEVIPAGEPLRVGCDPAGMGRDKTVIAVRKGDRLVELRKYEKKRTTEITGFLVGFINAGAERVMLDATGLSGIHDQMLELGHAEKTIPFSFGASPMDVPDADNPRLSARERYADTASWLWGNLASLLRLRKIALEYDEDLWAQLLNRRMRTLPNGKLKLESKDEFRERGFDSPDEADAVALAFAPDGAGLRTPGQAPWAEEHEDDSFTTI